MVTTQDIIDRDTTLAETIRHREQFGVELGNQLAQNAALVIALNADAEMIKESMRANAALIDTLRNSMSTARQNGSTVGYDAGMESSITALAHGSFIAPGSIIGEYLTRRVGPTPYGWMKIGDVIDVLQGPADHLAHLMNVGPVIINRDTRLWEYVIERFQLFVNDDVDRLTYTNGEWRFGKFMKGQPISWQDSPAVSLINAEGALGAPLADIDNEPQWRDDTNRLT